MRLVLALLCTLPLAASAADSPLTGTWTLVKADVLQPDGKQVHDYGEAPKGLFIVDAQGHYSLQIFNSLRPKFASGDRHDRTRLGLSEPPPCPLEVADLVHFVVIVRVPAGNSHRTKHVG